MKYSLVFVCVILYFFSAIAQNNQEKSRVLHTIEAKDTNELLSIYSDWHKNSTPIDSEELNKQSELERETYAIYSAILDYFVSPSEQNYVLVNNTINVEISLYNLSLDSIYKTLYKKESSQNVTDEYFEFYPRGCDEFIKLIEKQEVGHNYLNSTKNEQIIINNFKPFHLDNPLKLIYENEVNEYLELFEIAMTDSVIEQSLLKSGKTIKQIRETQGYKWRYWNEITKERSLRQDFYYSFRGNIKDKIKRIVFQPDFRTALIEYVSYYNDGGYTILYFEKINNKWIFKENYIHKIEYGSDSNPPIIR